MGNMVMEETPRARETTTVSVAANARKVGKFLLALFRGGGPGAGLISRLFSRWNNQMFALLWSKIRFETLRTLI